MSAPSRAVVRSQLGPRSQRIVFPNGDVAIVCGPPLRTDTLECGHKVTHHGPHRSRRRCDQCAGPETLPGFGAGNKPEEKPAVEPDQPNLRACALAVLAAWDADSTLERQDLSMELWDALEELRRAVADG